MFACICALLALSARGQGSVLDVFLYSFLCLFVCSLGTFLTEPGVHQLARLAGR